MHLIYLTANLNTHNHSVTHPLNCHLEFVQVSLNEGEVGEEEVNEGVCVVLCSRR